MSSGRHAARAYRGRHSARHAAPTRGLSSHAAIVAPLGAAVALVVTATGAAVADTDSSATALEVTTTQSLNATLEAATATADSTQITQRRSAASMQAAAVADRPASSQAASRSQTRKAIQAAAERAILERNGKKWVAPIKGMKPAGSVYGMRLHPVLGYWRMHYGNDYTAGQGTPLRAMSKGTIVSAGWMGGAGITVVIKYWDGSVSYYEHMSKTSVTAGQEVLPGDVVGLSGNTGLSTGPHLHLEIHLDGKGAVNPSPWFAERGMPY